MSLSMPMKFKLKNVDYIGLPFMFLSLGELWPQVVQQLFSKWNGSASGNGATKNGGITKGGVIRTSLSTRGPLLAFNPVVEFFHDELQRNYQRIRTKKL
jgi:hypothetical protein